MPYPEEHRLLTFGGPLGDLGEQWSMSLRTDADFVTTGDETAETEQARVDALGAEFVTLWANIVLVGSQAKLAWVKYNRINQAGHYVYPFTARFDQAPQAPGGSGSSTHPGQVALVASLTTAAGRGPAHAGRMYWPIPRYSVDSGLRISAANADAAASNVADFIGGVNDAIAPLNVRIYSQVGSGQQRLVTGVKVGRVLDTMRSRRTQLPEEYEEAPV